MLRVKLKNIMTKEILTGIIIQDMKDFSIFKKYLIYTEVKLMKQLVNSPEPFTRYDHEFSMLNGQAKSLMMLAWFHYRQSGNHPFYFLLEARQKKLLSIMNMLTRGETIFTNDKT